MPDILCRLLVPSSGYHEAELAGSRGPGPGWFGGAGGSEKLPGVAGEILSAVTLVVPVGSDAKELRRGRQFAVRAWGPLAGRPWFERSGCAVGPCRMVGGSCTRAEFIFVPTAKVRLPGAGNGPHFCPQGLSPQNTIWINQRFGFRSVTLNGEEPDGF